ncbi:phosphoribosyltransferase [Cytobacillus praedii]|uniref:Phosphoribosyltransferase n=1 Tax=Cytobacillus praedii TaxID=1742358 RepID=A0A4R1API1_9BACI|nr:hypothetical protein [Cytobacillus praedii]TCJ01331.1 hypothetical protein E0Y62_24460 [Cytobacillus praedii]
MSNVIIFPTATLLNNQRRLYEGIKDTIHKLRKGGNTIVFMSHDKSNFTEIINEFDFAKLAFRRDVREVIKADENRTFIIVGSSDDDLFIASSRKVILLNPLWSDVQEEKAVKYGLGVKSPELLFKIIQIIENQSTWFYSLEVDNKTKVYSLTSANTMGAGYSQSELEIVEGFRRVLKEGDKKYFNVLQLHFLASIINNQEFKEVDIWAIMPSSDIELNDACWELKERARLVMGKQKKEPLFIRHTTTTKSRTMTEKDRLYCGRHFETININPQYSKSLKNKTICVIDDYLTNGTSFETLRNLLYSLGVKKIIFVSLGRFKKKNGIEYYKQDYRITGDVFGNSYKYDLLAEKNISGRYNLEARTEIKELHDILHK